MEQKGQVIVYTVLGCPHCMRAKGTLREFGLTYTEIRLDLYQKEVREDLRNRTGKQTVPQIFFNDRYIGGNAELQKMVCVYELLYNFNDALSYGVHLLTFYIMTFKVIILYAL